MEKEEMQEYWRWRLFRVLAEYIHEPNRMNTSKLNLFARAYYYEFIKTTEKDLDPSIMETAELLAQDASQGTA
jgi:hypothetical protein